MQASEFEQDFAVRLEEKKTLEAVNCKGIRFNIKTSPGGWTTSQKISAILQGQVLILSLSVCLPVFSLSLPLYLLVFADERNTYRSFGATNSSDPNIQRVFKDNSRDD